MHSVYRRGCTETGNSFCKTVAGLSHKQNGGMSQKAVVGSRYIALFTMKIAVHETTFCTKHYMSAQANSQWLQADPAKRRGCNAHHAKFCSCIASCRFVLRRDWERDGLQFAAVPEVQRFYVCGR